MYKFPRHTEDSDKAPVVTGKIGAISKQGEGLVVLHLDDPAGSSIVVTDIEATRFRVQGLLTEGTRVQATFDPEDRLTGLQLAA